MTVRRLALALTLSISLSLATAACGGLKTSHDFDPNAPFDTYQTWYLVEVAANPALDQLTVQRLESSIERTLANKGMRRSDGEAGEFAVGYQVILDEEVSYNTVNTGYGGGWGYGGWYGPGYGGIGMSTSRTYENRVTVGTLIIDMFDTGTRQLVWRGTGESEVQQIRDPVERQNRLNAIVDKILESFPPSTN